MKLDETERNLAHSYVDNAYEHYYQGDIEVWLSTEKNGDKMFIDELRKRMN